MEKRHHTRVQISNDRISERLFYAIKYQGNLNPYPVSAAHALMPFKVLLNPLIVL
jgi:hypothetical protein